MSDLKAALLSVALSLPSPWYPPGKNPETNEQYRARVGVIAEAVALEADAAAGWKWGTRALAVATLTLMYHESRFDLPVHSGDILGDHGRASCLGQIHVSGLVPKQEWLELTGVDVDSTRRCARATMRLLVAQYRSCGLHKQPLSMEGMASMFAKYATGTSCRPSGSSRARALEWQRFMTEPAPSERHFEN
jgi:hypothetical protein